METEIKRVRQPQQLSSLIKQQISSMTSQRRTSCITEVSKEAKALRKAMKPSEIISAYSIDLQTSAMAVFPTIDKTSEVRSPKLGVMSEAFPETIDNRTGETVKDMAVTWMESQLLAVSMFCGAREKMNEWQSRSLCTQIISEHPQLTLMEFILFCARLRSARYGKFYGSIDPAEILGSLDMFLKDRSRDLWKRQEEEEKLRKEREYEEARKNAVSYEEYMRHKAERAKSLKVNEK